MEEESTVSSISLDEEITPLDPDSDTEAALRASFNCDSILLILAWQKYQNRLIQQ